MIALFVLCTLLLAAVLLILLAALRRAARPLPVDRERLNVSIFRERRAELDAELAAGRLDAAQHAGLLAELELLLVDDIDAVADDAGARSLAPRTLALVLLALVPLLVGGLYFVTGFDAEVRSWVQLRAHEAAVAELPLPIDAQSAQAGDLTLRDAARLRQTMLGRDAADAEAWFRLGATWIEADVPLLALQSLRTATRLAPERADIALALARLELIAGNGQLTPAVRALFDRVLALDPRNQTALLVYGMSAFDSGDYDTAIARWEQLLALLDPRAQGAGLLRESIAKARAKRELAAAPGTGIPVRVVLSPSLATDAAALPPEAALFVIVRVAGGPPVPVAAKKLPPRLPAELTLTDADQMMPGAPLAQRGPLEVRARLSRTGTPMPAAGDLESAPLRIEALSPAPLTLTVDRRLP
ncbi:MAG: c-type cytochrome biogenesis protein CcmI [Pseudomonadota bacterium]